MAIVGIEKLSLVDYENKLVATLFISGCNFRCPFCHNSSLVINSDIKSLDFDEILAYLKSTKKMLDAICITGGEPTLDPNLKSYLTKIKALGFEIKLDTNGTNPEVIKKLYKDKLIDYVAMDIKSSPNNYHEVVGLSKINISNIKESIKFLINSGMEYEFRTTLVNEYHHEKEIIEIAELIKGAKRYRLQKFINSENCINHNLHEVKKETAEGFLRIIIDSGIKDSELRGY